MSKSIEIQILDKIRKAKRGSLFFTENFSMYGNADALRKALERLVKSEELERLVSGIYYRPAHKRFIGQTYTKY